MTRDLERARQAAADLRNAAYVMELVGGAKGSFSNGSSVCMEGAIRLATSSLENLSQTERSQLDRTNPGATSSFQQHRLTINGQDPDRTYAATIALGEILPDTCSTQHAPGEECRVSINKHERVYHFNDFVCSGNQESVALLVTAAEKLEADL